MKLFLNRVKSLNITKTQPEKSQPQSRDETSSSSNLIKKEKHFKKWLLKSYSTYNEQHKENGGFVDKAFPTSPLRPTASDSFLFPPSGEEKVEKKEFIPTVSKLVLSNQSSIKNEYRKRVITSESDLNEIDKGLENIEQDAMDQDADDQKELYIKHTKITKPLNGQMKREMLGYKSQCQDITRTFSVPYSSHAEIINCSAGGLQGFGSCKDLRLFTKTFKDKESSGTPLKGSRKNSKRKDNRDEKKEKPSISVKLEMVQKLLKVEKENMKKVVDLLEAERKKNDNLEKKLLVYRTRLMCLGIDIDLHDNVYGL